MTERSRFALGIEPTTVGGDKAYGFGPAVRCMVEAGAVPHAPAADHPGSRKGAR
ncbi:MAG: hypothetical protein M9963_02380 [Kiritimatiellae bacterium]|nr:hypothetical protein [Kiritimatiellia bacterium]MCO5060842.1 hypothetical protein [Kiritimatiellia bacterium]MCO6401702.1 hypothetical protein [Verrucomicrobiota bacterium]